MKNRKILLLLAILAIAAIGTGALALVHGKGEIKLNEKLLSEFDRQHKAAAALLADGRYNLAEQAARQLCGIAPDHHDSIRFMIAALCGQKRYREALSYSRKLIEKYPRNAAFRLDHAGLLLKSDEVLEALDEFEKTWKIAPESIEVNLRLAQVYDDLWRFDQAGRHRFLASLLQSRPGNAQKGLQP